MRPPQARAAAVPAKRVSTLEPAWRCRMLGTLPAEPISVLRDTYDSEKSQTTEAQNPEEEGVYICIYIYIYIYVILPTQPREAGASEANDHNANYATKNTNDYNAICVYTCIVCIHIYVYIYIYIHICT